MKKNEVNIKTLDKNKNHAEIRLEIDKASDIEKIQLDIVTTKDDDKIIHYCGNVVNIKNIQ